MFVLAEGNHVNGSELIEGLAEASSAGVHATGGWSATAPGSRETFVLANGMAGDPLVSAGPLRQGLAWATGPLGGWDPSDRKRLITRSRGEPALRTGRAGAPSRFTKTIGGARPTPPGARAGFFHLRFGPPDSRQWLVRTVLAVNETEKA